MGLQFKEISAYQAIREIYNHPNIWSFLYGFVEDSEEVDLDDDGEICFIYGDGKSTDKNFFTNDDKFFWIAGYENGKLNFLQLMNKVNGSHLELVIAQKKSTSKSKDCFGKLVEWLIANYKFKYLTTYPMNDKLKEYYIDNGFYQNKEFNLKDGAIKCELRLDIR